MNKPLRRLFVVFVLMFGVLVGFTSWWTVFGAEDLKQKPSNRRPLLKAQKIPRGLILETSAFKSGQMKYRMCDRNGCFVQMPIDNSAISSIAKSGPDAKVRIFADSGKAYELKFSLKGFSAAHDSMVEQARAKAKSVPVAGAPTAPAAPAATP